MRNSTERALPVTGPETPSDKNMGRQLVAGAGTVVALAGGVSVATPKAAHAHVEDAQMQFRADEEHLTTFTANCDTPPENYRPESYDFNQSVQLLEEITSRYEDDPVGSYRDYLNDISEAFGVEFMLGSDDEEFTPYYNEGSLLTQLEPGGVAQHAYNESIYRDSVEKINNTLEMYHLEFLQNFVGKVRIVGSITDPEGRGIAGYYSPRDGERIITISISASEGTNHHEVGHLLQDVLCDESEEGNGYDYRDETFTSLNRYGEYVGAHGYHNYEAYRYTNELFTAGRNQEFASHYAATNRKEDFAETFEHFFIYGVPQEGDPDYGSPFASKVEEVARRFDLMSPGTTELVRQRIEQERAQYIQEHGSLDGYFMSTYESYASSQQEQIAANVQGELTRDMLPTNSVDVTEDMNRLAENGEAITLLRGSVMILTGNRVELKGDGIGAAETDEAIVVHEPGIERTGSQYGYIEDVADYIYVNAVDPASGENRVFKVPTSANMIVDLDSRFTSAVSQTERSAFAVDGGGYIEPLASSEQDYSRSLHSTVLERDPNMHEHLLNIDSTAFITESQLGFGTALVTNSEFVRQTVAKLRIFDPIPRPPQPEPRPHPNDHYTRR